jgi:hypothetical protein
VIVFFKPLPCIQGCSDIAFFSNSFSSIETYIAGRCYRLLPLGEKQYCGTLYAALRMVEICGSFMRPSEGGKRLLLPWCTSSCQCKDDYWSSAKTERIIRGTVPSSAPGGESREHCLDHSRYENVDFLSRNFVTSNLEVSFLSASMPPDTQDTIASPCPTGNDYVDYGPGPHPGPLLYVWTHRAETRPQTPYPKNSMDHCQRVEASRNRMHGQRNPGRKTSDRANL